MSVILPDILSKSKNSFIHKEKEMTANSWVDAGVHYQEQSISHTKVCDTAY